METLLKEVISSQDICNFIIFRTTFFKVSGTEAYESASYTRQAHTLTETSNGANFYHVTNQRAFGLREETGAPERSPHQHGEHANSTESLTTNSGIDLLTVR